LVVGLASLSDPDLVPSAVGAALGVPLSGGDHTRALVAWLRDRNTLLVLDNCEHVIGTTAALAEAILQAAPQAGILATAREPLRTEGEWLHRLAPLELPPEAEASPTAAEALGYSAVEPFNERATATTDSFVLDDANVPAVLEICRRLDSVPLALELAAARVDTFSVGEGSPSQRQVWRFDERSSHCVTTAADTARGNRLELWPADGAGGLIATSARDLPFRLHPRFRSGSNG
jgi:predicted ATPase